MYAGQTIRGKLGHKDFTSSYPCQQMTKYFPVGAPTWYGEIEDQEELNYLLSTYCCIFELTLTDVHIKEGVTAPCIPSSKCIGLVEPVRLNGKIVYAKQLSIACTELDYNWVCRQYDAEKIYISNMLIFERGLLPDWLKDRIMYYFKNKCELKGKDELLYNKSKAFLNAIYGMTGGQMAPTSLPGQITQTTPYGRDVKTAGYPVRICEMLSTLDGVALAQRVTVDCVKTLSLPRRPSKKHFRIRSMAKVIL